MSAWIVSSHTVTSESTHRSDTTTNATVTTQSISISAFSSTSSGTSPLSTSLEPAPSTSSDCETQYSSSPAGSRDPAPSLLSSTYTQTLPSSGEIPPATSTTTVVISSILNDLYSSTAPYSSTRSAYVAICSVASNGGTGVHSLAPGNIIMPSPSQTNRNIGRSRASSSDVGLSVGLSLSVLLLFSGGILLRRTLRKKKRMAMRSYCSTAGGESIEPGGMLRCTR